jgi:hypothetical protein
MMANFTADTLLPEIVSEYPATRAVFDRYGLHGCGGPTGPHETVGWFARLHGVPVERLLDELNAAAQAAQPERIAFEPSLADTIYRPFFIAGIAVALSIGVTFGAINLFLIGWRKSFGGIDFSWTLAHGHAMIFGFVGLFIMGFAYQAFPRLKHTRLWRPRLAFVSLPLMLLGVIAQAAAHLFADRSIFIALGLMAGSLQLIAVAIFAVVVAMTLKSAPHREPFDRFIRASLSWWLAVAIANPFIFWMFETARTRDQFILRISTFDLPYREMELFGAIVMMILGVSIRLLPHAYGLRSPSLRWIKAVFWIANAAIIVSVTSFVFGMLRGDLRLAALQEILGVAFLAIALGLPKRYRLFGPVRATERDRGLKFIRAAHVWFIFAMTMFVLMPFYGLFIYRPLTGAELPFSHAYLGAYRHALTVGFITLMIVGVSSKVVPTLSGVDLKKADQLWLTFILVNLGSLMRVSTQIATDYTPAAYSVMGISGFIELLGLTLWGIELGRNIRAGKRLEREPIVLKIDGPFRLTPQTKVAEVLERYPQTLSVFLARGLAPLRNPALRRTMARVVTIEQACQREGIDLDALLADLRHAIARSQTSLPGAERGEKRR